MAGRAVLVTLALGLNFLAAQTISVETREVAVDVTVTDSKGATVGDLKKEDFTLKDEGKLRAFDFSITTHFEPISGQPGPLRPSAPRPDGGGPAPEIGHSTALLLDEANAFAEDTGVMHVQVNRLIAKAPQGERIALYAMVRFRGLVLIQDYTIDRDLLRKSLARHVTASQGVGPSGRFYIDQPHPPDARPPYPERVDAELWRRNSENARLSLEGLAEQLTLVSGRKSLFWITAGFNPWVMGIGNPPRSSEFFALSMLKAGWEKTLNVLNQANVGVNVVDVRGVYMASDPVAGTIGAMREIADRTGGKAYYGRNDLDDAIVEGITASRATYTLRFQLSEEERDKRFHELKVAVNRPGMQLFYRQGYYAGGMQRPTDLVTGRVLGLQLETLAASGAPPLDAFIQLPWFYSGTNRATVHLAIALKAAPREPVEIVGITLDGNGKEVSRFADHITVESGGRYEHPFTLPLGSYTFRLTAGSGKTVIGSHDVPLHIEHEEGWPFEVGSIALSREVRPVLPGPPPAGALIAGGKEFVPAGDTRFRKSEAVYFYSEIHDPAGMASLTARYRIFAAGSIEAKFDSGIVPAARFAQPEKSVIPFAAILPVVQLSPGKYRLEVQAGHVGSEMLIARIVDFEVVP